MSKHLEHKNLIARWMDGRLNSEEAAQLEASGELDALKAVIDDIDTWKVKPFDAEAGLAELNKKKSAVVHLNTKKSKSWLGIAASLALLFCSGLIWFLMSNSGTTIATEIAEKKTIELPTGSVVELDAASSITYDEKDWEANRALSLEGQAFFDVTSGASFVVATPTAKVAVLGTQFNIKAEKERFSVVCYEGKIEVTYKGNAEIITIGQRIVIENGTLRKSAHQKTAPEWLNGSSSYDRTPLNEVIADLQRYYNVSMSLPQKYTALLFSGTIQHNDLKGALNTIFTSMEIKYFLNDNDKVIFE